MKPRQIKIAPSPERLASDARSKGLIRQEFNFDRPVTREDLMRAMAKVTRRETLINPADWQED